jgi:hypothetical protein
MVFGGLVWNNKKQIEIDGRSNIALNSVGLERDILHSRVTSTNLRIGVLDKLYQLKGSNQLLVFDADKLPDQFKKGPKVVGLTVLGDPLPNLSSNAIGMINTRSKTE